MILVAFAVVTVAAAVQPSSGFGFVLVAIPFPRRGRRPVPAVLG